MIPSSSVFAAFTAEKEPVAVMDLAFGKNRKDLLFWGYGILPKYRKKTGLADFLRDIAVKEAVSCGRSLLWGEIRVNNFASIAKRLKDEGSYLTDYLPNFYKKGEDWFTAITKIDVNGNGQTRKKRPDYYREFFEKKIKSGLIPFLSDIPHETDEMPPFFAVEFKDVHLWRKIFETQEKFIYAILPANPAIFVFGPMRGTLEGLNKNHLSIKEAKQLLGDGNAMFSPKWEIVDFRFIEAFGDIVCVPSVKNPEAMATIVYGKDPDVAYLWHFGARPDCRNSAIFNELIKQVRRAVYNSRRKRLETDNPVAKKYL